MFKKNFIEFFFPSSELNTNQNDEENSDTVTSSISSNFKAPKTSSSSPISDNLMSFNSKKRELLLNLWPS